MVPRAALTASDPIGARSRCSSAGRSGAGSCSPAPGESLGWLRGWGCGSMGAAVSKLLSSCQLRRGRRSMAAGALGTREGAGDAVAPCVCGCSLLDPARICCLVAWEAGRCRRGALQHPQGLARCRNPVVCASGEARWAAGRAKGQIQRGRLNQGPWTLPSWRLSENQVH